MGQTCWGDNSKGQITPPLELTINCAYHIEPPSYLHAAAATAGTVTVFTSAAECPWTASSQVDWVTITWAGEWCRNVCGSGQCQ